MSARTEAVVSRGALTLEGSDTPPDGPVGPHTSIGVADQHVNRSASSTAHALAWGSAEGEFRGRELNLTIEVGADGNIGGDETITDRTLATVTFNPTNSRFGYADPADVPDQEKVTFNTEIGNLPLLVMALQDALRLGIERGSFPDPHGAMLTDFSRPDRPDDDRDDEPGEAS